MNRIDKILRVPLVDATKRDIERLNDSTRTGIVGFCFLAKFIQTKTVHGFAHIITIRTFIHSCTELYWQTIHYLFFTSALKPAV